MSIDPVELARELIARPSVTPADAGAMELVRRGLEGLGFACRRMRFGEVENLYARRGTGGPNLCFAGHTDVVPPGDESAWSSSPFAAEVREGRLIGRGAVDMKGAIAAWIAAVAQVGATSGSLSLLITGDEEGPALDGTRRVVETLAEEGERIDHCIVGEPTSARMLGDQIKIGRRGSLNAVVIVRGRQGHVAYPHRAANPIPPLLELLTRLKARALDEGVDGFQPSNLEVTTIDVGNAASNVIPAEAKARLNVRFNPSHSGASLAEWLQREAEAAQEDFDGEIALEVSVPGEPFLTEPGPFTGLVAGAVRATLGLDPEFSTTGGSSDARFIRRLCPVVEFGLVGATMHMVDENASVDDIRRLSICYAELIRRYHASFGG
ncbi:MAG TPA: succinyl-diaminopimelate desuccinylase [Caulobacteraceae bacterium]|jgi:succinyl-diaminopimelate desuccinylase